MADKRVIHFVLSSEDGDLIAWKNSLPKRRFNRTVCEILVSESKGTLAAVPLRFSSAECSESVHCLLRLQDENAIRLIDSIDPGEVTPYIKKIIRKHIKKNRSKPKSVSAKLLIKLVANIQANLEHEQKILDDYYEDLYSENYGCEMPKLFSSVIEAYKIGDENYGDEVLAQLADEKAISELFYAWGCDYD